MTVGSAQLPPTQPYSAPSAVMIALSPGLAEVGFSTLTTTATAKGSSLRDSSSALAKNSMSIIHYSCWFVLPMAEAGEASPAPTCLLDFVGLGLFDPFTRDYSVTPCSRSIFQSLFGVIGISMFRTPRCHSASTKALAITTCRPTVAV